VAAPVAHPFGTPFHARTFPLCRSLSYRDWSGYYAVSSYEPHHEHEYNAIRNAAALIDISPLFKYSITGRDATRLVNRIVTRDVSALDVGRVCYTPWCDERGHVIDDGTVARLGEQRFRWTAAEPSLRWFTQNAHGLDVNIADVSEQEAALALQGPLSARVLGACASLDVDHLPYFGVASAQIHGVGVDISRTGYTGDLGYEIWIPRENALTVWDAIVAAGAQFDLLPAGLLALDVVRVEAGLVLIDVDYTGSRKALTPAQRYSPYELGLGRLVRLDKERFVGRAALRQMAEQGPSRQIVGIQIDWSDVEVIYGRVGLPPVAPAATSRVPVPVMRGDRQVGRATSTTWSPILKQLIALASVDRPYDVPRTGLRFEVTVEGVRHFVGATVVERPFFSPSRKTALPPP